jgi:hypothetical protein
VPSESSVAVWWSRKVLIEPVERNVSVAGSKTSAVERTLDDVSAVLTEASAITPDAVPAELEYPPVISTRPSSRRVAVWNWRAASMAPVGLKVPVAGS